MTEKSDNLVFNQTLTTEPEPMLHDGTDETPGADTRRSIYTPDDSQAVPRLSMSSDGHALATSLPLDQPPIQNDSHRDSISVIEASFTIGNLSLTNPDAPTPDQATPLQLPKISLSREEAEDPVMIVEPINEPVLAPQTYKNLPPEPAPSIISRFSKVIPPPDTSPTPPPIEAFSSALYTGLTPTIPSPSELAYMASPGMPPQDEMPSIPSPTSTAAPLPPLRDDYNRSRSPQLLAPGKSIPWTSEEPSVSRTSVMANPPTPFASPQPSQSQDEVSRRSSPTRKAVVYTEVDMFASSARKRTQSQSQSPVNATREPSPAKPPSQDRVASPTFPATSPMSPITPYSYATALEDRSREPSPTKIHRERTRENSPIKGPREYNREGSPTKVHRQPSREHSPTKIHREADREPSPTKPHRHRDRESVLIRSPTKEKESTTVRRTETFRLVRSQSGGVVQSKTLAETIIANGQHWEVIVEPTLQTKRSQKDRGSTDMVDPDAVGSKRESRRKEKERATSEEPEPIHSGRKESRRRHTTSNGDELHQSSKRDSKRRDKHRSDGDGHGEPRRSSMTISRNLPPTDSHRVTTPEQPSGSGLRDSVNTRSERRPSMSVRPTSEVVLESDSAPLRARDADNLDRLFWRGHSVVLDGTNSGLITTPPPSQAPLPSMQGATMHAFGLGSSQTNYTHQAPFPAPAPQPPVLYPPVQQKIAPVTPAPPPAIPRRSTARSTRTPVAPSVKASTNGHVNGETNGHAHSYDVGLNGRPTSNPLPDPPRPSKYRTRGNPPPVETSAPGSREYWTKYAGLTAS